MLALREIAKEVLAAGLLIALVVSSLWIATGSMPPLVVVESNSMMHNEQGEIGAIDPGDLILLLDKSRHGEIMTYVEALEKNDGEKHGKFGAVIIYKKNGLDGTPIIHRSILKVVAHTAVNPTEEGVCEDGAFDEHVQRNDGTKGGCIVSWSVPGTNLKGVSNITLDLPGIKCIPEGHVTVQQATLRIENWVPKHEGYLTLGDHNGCRVDQRGAAIGAAGLTDSEGKGVESVREEWVVGVAGGEIPWLGSLKLLTLDQGEGASQVPKSSWVKLAISIASLMLLMQVDGIANRWLKKSPEIDQAKIESDAWGEEE